MRLTPEDDVEIANLLAAYCLALDHDEIDRCVALFTEDGSFEVYGRAFQGHDSIAAMMRNAPRGLHLGGPPFVEVVEGDRARAQQNLLFVDRSSGETRRAVYADELRRTQQGWRIHKRRCQFLVASGLGDPPERRGAR